MAKAKLVVPKAEAKEGKWHTRLVNEWIPVPEHLLQALGWAEGQELELLVITGHQLVVRRKGALADPGSERCPTGRHMLDKGYPCPECAKEVD